MSIKDGKDYLYLIWKCVSTRRHYIVGQLTKNKHYEFCYCEEINDAIKAGFVPLVSFKELNVVYKSEELFPVFSSRLPDRKRKDIDKILKKYGLEKYDSYQLLKKSGARLPIDNLQFIDPILNFEEKFKKTFYIAGTRHYLGCEGNSCLNAVSLTRGDEVFLEHDENNLYDKNAVRIVNQQSELLGYVPRYYAQAFVRFINEGRVEGCYIISVEKKDCCDECIGVEIRVSALKIKENKKDAPLN